jgi:hypothetical protein
MRSSLAVVAAIAALIGSSTADLVSAQRRKSDCVGKLQLPRNALDYNIMQLVPALKKCDNTGATCVPRQFESRYTFHDIVLRWRRSNYARGPLYLTVIDVRDPSGTHWRAT